MVNATPFPLDGLSLTLDHFAEVVLAGAPCELSDAARGRVLQGREGVERAMASGEAVYGLNTGFGDLASVRIEPDRLALLQQNLILSHAAGMGERLPDEAVRGMLLLRANTLARGCSGVRPVVIEQLLALLNSDVLPVVPSRGSVGASGDLAPLAHLALPLLGRGRVRWGGEEMPAAVGLPKAGLDAGRPLILEAKEGLALINGTQAMTSLLALASLEARRLLRLADLIGALTTDALRGTDTAFDSRIHAVRPHPGQRASAANLWKLLQGSAIRESHRTGDVRVQDPYSIRCMPQVHGAARGFAADVEAKLAVELNAATDNPLIFCGASGSDEGGDAILSGGNFHGEMMAMSADVLAIALCEIAGISERRIEKLTNAAFSGLPPFLVRDAGLNSGFMIAQVTAAALVAENRVLAHPASVDSIPTSADKEDHVSMGMGAALKLRAVVDNVRRVLAIELVAAAQGIDLLRPLTSSPPLEALHAAVRRAVGPWDEDREMSPDLLAAEAMLRGELDEHLYDLE